MTPAEQAGDRNPDENPLGSVNNAIFTAIRWNVYSPREIELASATPIYIILTIGIDSYSDSIHGDNLWRVDLFASRNRDGSGKKYYLKERILSERYRSKNLDNTAKTLNFSINTEIEYYGINCHPNDPSFFCIEFSQGENRNFNVPIYGDDGLRNCQEIQCKAPGGVAAHHDSGESREHGSGLPQAMVSSVGWSTGSYSVSRSQPSRMNMHIIVTPMSTSNTISGSGLWEVTIFGSEHPEGSGPRFNQNRNILNSRQDSQTLYADEDMTFDVEFDFMMGQIGCDGVNYFCVEFSKGNRARPDFEMPSTTGHNAIRRCQERSCPFPVGGSKRALITNINFSTGSGTGNAPRGQRNMDITATLATNENSDRIEGEGLWRLGAFGSQNSDGSGTRLNEVRNMLSDDDASITLVPGRDLVLPGNANLNLQGIGTGQDYPYFCMEFSKGDHSTPDFDLPMSQGSIISCSSIEGNPVDEGKPRVMVSGFSSSYGIGQEYQDGTTDVTIEVTVTPHANSDPLSGRNLWKLGVFGSGHEDGTGRRRPVSPQILIPPKSGTPLYPARDLQLVVTDNLDVRGIGPDTQFPYLCVEFGKDPYASPDYDMELGGAESIITCHDWHSTEETDGHNGPDPGHRGTDLGHIGTDSGHGGTDPGHGRPDSGHGGNMPDHGGNRRRALVSRFGYELGTRAVPHSHLTNVQVTASVTPHARTDTITGRDLWRVGIFGSSESDGSGPRMGEVQQLLPEDEQAKTLESGVTLTLEGSVTADLRRIGGSEYPYLCVEFGKANSDSNFDLPVNNPRGTLFSCRVFETNHGGNGDDDPHKPNAIFARFMVGINPSAIPGSHLTRVEIDATVTPHEETDYVADGEFRLGVFGNDNQDGTGERINEVRQILPARDRVHPVYSGRPVDLDVTSDLDLRGIGEGTNYPYLCVEFDKFNDHVNFDMPMNTATGTFVACKMYTSPESDTPDSDMPQALIGNLRTSLGFMMVPGTNLLETTVGAVVTSQSDSHYIPADVNWRLGIYGSAQSDGAGQRKKEVTQLLSPTQQRRSWAPSETATFRATEQLDLVGIGLGTNYPYLCIEFDKANDHVNFDLPQGSMVACSEFDNPVSAEPEPEPEPDHPRVTVTSVVPDKGVKGKEKGRVDATFDVVVGIDPSSDDVHGNNLWVLTVFLSKKKTGRGTRVGEVSQALSRAQESQTIQNRKKLAFRDISTTLDLSRTKCKDAKYLCAEILQGSNQNFELDSSVVGCQKLKCQKKDKKKKAKPASISTGTTLTISSITPSEVSIFANRMNRMTFSAPITFDPAQSDALTRGVDLWKMSIFFNNEASDSHQHMLEEQVLVGNKKFKLVRDPASSFGFGQFELEMDLRGFNCKKLKFFCVKLTPDNPTPPFTLANASRGANIGCRRTRCR